MDLLKLFYYTTVSIVEGDVDLLFPPPMVAVGAMCKLDLELLNCVTLFLRVDLDFVDARRLKPVLAPSVKIERLQGLRFIVSNLHASYEVWKRRVSPLVASEVDLQSCTEGLPV